ncbi:LysE family translocator [Vibrio neptunius]|uniref:LysE family translocator n=1 Tax=Vibrio neptunius TaxID=170651 RepID=A0ABS3A349_9VIBR|nr:LysE family translocator [Vibrio neptunius]MBN3494119.1 LysE family translocator [Vibrio neptunius]MBN3516885.1 LysE family translocator [Vibrio neptunius]MBN3550790.1 LysE family translocator [Vibrio neptunius]MBN3574795.1 LysE family translocator [Vibrio neptunius]MBN3578921.1 LysE family translocator [Vibrio neptunius]
MENLILAMVVFAFVGAVTPGPVNLLATTTAVNDGLRAALKHVLGASIAYAVVVFATGQMMQTLVAILPKLEVWMQLIGSSFLFYLAYQIFAAPVKGVAVEPVKSSGWLTGSLTQIVNPKAWLVAMSGVSLYVLGQENEQYSLWLFTLVSLFVCVIGVGVWAMIGGVLANRLANPRVHRQFNRLMAIMLCASVVLIWL